MATKKIIAVIGSTGAQGGGLARAILADKTGEFQVRAVTRKPDSDNARALKAAGAEIVTADLDDADSRELNPQLQNFDQWLAANAKKIPLE